MLTRIRKCLDLLAPPERWRWAVLVPLAIVAAGLEAVGAAAVFALIRLVGDPSQAVGLPFIGAVAASHGGPATVLAATVVVGVFYVLKNVYLLFVAAAQSRLIADSVVSVSRRMLQGYLGLPFVSQLRRNSAELIRNTTYSVQTSFGQVLEPAFGAITEASITAAIITVLMIKAPLVTLIAAVILCTTVAALLTLTRRALARWGHTEQELRGQVQKTLQQTFHGLKEIKIRGRESFYYDSFSDRQRALAHVQHLNAIWLAASRLLIETVFVCGVLLLIVLTTLRSGTGMEVVPLLGLYAFAGFRVIPSVNRMLVYLGRIQQGSAALDVLHADLQVFRAVADDAPSAGAGTVVFADRLVLQGVSFTYGTQRPALQDIDLTVARGTSVGIVGPTGAGKSTLIDLILGLLRPSEGHIAVDGIDIFAALRSWQSKIGYVPQSVYLMDDSVRRNVALGVPDDEIDDRKVRAALEMAQLDGVVAALPDGLDTLLGERGARLSGGERQRVAIARALYDDPELLVFDEATAALDARTERELTSAIDGLHGKKTLIIIAHRLSTVRRCDRLVFLRAGRIEAHGSFEELVAGNAQFRSLAFADHA